MVKKTLTIRALTSLHPGSGTGIGVIDMPVQRERHTGYPTIPGSSIKGVLRQVSTVSGINKEVIFGPENKEGEQGKYASSASFSDARIFAFPVRSLKGVFAWVTCPEVIRRLKNEGLISIANIPSVQDQEIICSSQNYLVVSGLNKVVLEEYDFVVIGQTIDRAILDFGIKFFNDQNDQTAFVQRFAIISDNDFAHFVRYATEVNARIALVPETKNAKDGALFYEEFLPSETLFYSTVIFENSRKEKDNTTAEQIVSALQIPNPVQFGGDETIGKGFCEVHLI
ncbi:MAG TPA: type III-B CRISPR module RAMP protein Cmr4 [Elusimicrobiales bacterium]|nr:type III-B CRISPR module RAMP protein Cmr4 [Elusimicrobiales bacterium]HOL62310.1 type III-B CRISPR module RAMP protein Cmr4 [Elusimicrobiales bacterium]HPO94973.1 type III-B CRISPR module RAMP protein Cmr4 [Elusimicrobiales bacterium]